MMSAMKIQLSGGVVASGRRAWVAGRSGPVEVVNEPVLPLGAPVALGPDDARADQVEHAVNELARLVAAGGAAAAGAGVYLGSGFVSARLAGARGDQRDAVLAALRVLGVEQADRLGDRAGFLVALFGPAATKRVGAAVSQAIGEGRWAAVALASAASDVLGPEQLESVLALEPPADVEMVPGPASALAQHLRQALAPVSAPRRLGLLLDLWAQVTSHQAELARRARLLATQSRKSRTEDLRKRRKHHDDELILGLLRNWIADPEERLADVARWTPPHHYWRQRLDGIIQDAFAATALLRTAVAVGEHGLNEGLERSADLLRVAESLLPAPAAAAAARKVTGLTGLPTRPGAYVRDIHRRLASAGPRDHRFEGFMRPRLACGRDFALVIMREVDNLLDDPQGPGSEVLKPWAASDMRSRRKDFGYSHVRPPAEWHGIPHWTDEMLGVQDSLAGRLAAKPTTNISEVELVGDLLWYAELADALAALHGHSSARGPLVIGAPWLDHDPQPPVVPLVPRLDSVTLAVSGAAQLVALGATPPKRVKGWRDLTDGLLASTSIAEAITGEFTVPAPLATLDGTAIAGTGLRLRVARNARTLAEWSDYMGNCIAGQYYVDRARAGQSVLTGLYDKNGVLVVNAELVPRRPTARGWRVEEIQARFNYAPDEVLERRFRSWVDTVPAATVSENAPALPLPDEVPPGRAPRRRSVPRLVEDVGPALGPLVQQAWADVEGEALSTFAALAETTPDAALTRLRRLGSNAVASSGVASSGLADACRRTLVAGTVSLHDLWAASGVRPLRTAVAALDPALSDGFDQLALLFSEPPMAKSLRRLVKLPAIADAYAQDLVARSVRKAIGDLACRDDEVIAHAFTGRTTEPLLCALTVMITCRAPEIDLMAVVPPRTVNVPGYPATTLDDETGPWQRAFPTAGELGADTAVFWDEIANHGLRVPASWLTHGGWIPLWTRAHR